MNKFYKDNYMKVITKLMYAGVEHNQENIDKEMYKLALLEIERLQKEVEKWKELKN